MRAAPASPASSSDLRASSTGISTSMPDWRQGSLYVLDGVQAGDNLVLGGLGFDTFNFNFTDYFMLTGADEIDWASSKSKSLGINNLYLITILLSSIGIFHPLQIPQKL